ncbi:MAG: hypothetical protein IKL53_01240 [Lachnospiraceae bacterium]|nr:hypothetical protein [Lachnospiraceae bacterium]
MRLFVTDNLTDETPMDVVMMSTLEFGYINNIPFIISQMFDAIVVDITDNVKLGYLSKFMKVTRVIPRIVGDITPHCISLLSEIYKDKSAELRYTYMRNKEDIKPLLDKMCVDYEWSKFY